MMTIEKFIEEFEPCEAGRDWLVDNCDNLEQAWIECPRGDWLMSVCIGYQIDEKLFVLTIIECIKITSDHLPEACLKALDDLKSYYTTDGKISSNHQIKPIADNVEREWSKFSMPRLWHSSKYDRLYMQKRCAVRACKRLIEGIIDEWEYSDFSNGMVDIARATGTDGFYCYKTFNRMADICRYHLTASVMFKLARM